MLFYTSILLPLGDRALRSRASSEELKARNAKRKLKNLEFCHHADNAKFEKAIPVPTHASTHQHGACQAPTPCSGATRAPRDDERVALAVLDLGLERRSDIGDAIVHCDVATCATG